MNKCLKITLGEDVPEAFLRTFVQKHARSLELEGTAQVVEGEGVIIVCGRKEEIDTLLDVLHKGTSSYRPEFIEVEPFLRDKDYRGVFRVIG